MSYSGLDPVKMLDYPLSDIIDLMRQHLDYSRRHREDQSQATPSTVPKEKVIYRKADDSWF